MTADEFIEAAARKGYDAKKVEDRVVYAHPVKPWGEVLFDRAYDCAGKLAGYREPSNATFKVALSAL